MKQVEQRRDFLRKLALAAGGLCAVGGLALPSGAAASSWGHYEPDAPFSSDLAPGEEAVLHLSGLIRQGSGQTPLAGAVVEVWHADAQGQFHKRRYRGRVQADAQGRYALRTVLPGRLAGESPWGHRKLFFRVSAPGMAPQESCLYLSEQGQAYIHSSHWAQSPIGPLGELPQANPGLQGLSVTYHHRLA
jgi:protocatechuate 3,4-dioxygenase beta subunit